MSSTFNSLAYFEKLKEAGAPEKLARVQADTLQEALDKTTVTRDYLDSRLKELELRNRESELRLLKWQIGIGITIILIVAKGFGWLGF